MLAFSYGNSYRKPYLVFVIEPSQTPVVAKRIFTDECNEKKKKKNHVKSWNSNRFLDRLARRPLGPVGYDYRGR